MEAPVFQFGAPFLAKESAVFCQEAEEEGAAEVSSKNGRQHGNVGVGRYGLNAETGEGAKHREEYEVTVDEELGGYAGAGDAFRGGFVLDALTVRRVYGW